MDRDVLAESEDVGTETDRGVHLADPQLPADRVHLLPEVQDCAEGRARHDPGPPEVEQQAGLTGPEQGPELLAECGGRLRALELAGQDLDDRDAVLARPL